MARIPISCGAAADTLVVGTLAVVVDTLVVVAVGRLVVGTHCPYVACALVVVVVVVVVFVVVAVVRDLM